MLSLLPLFFCLTSSSGPRSANRGAAAISEVQEIRDQYLEMHKGVEMHKGGPKNN